MSRSQKVLRYTRVIDLSHDLHPEIPRWPGDPEVNFETVADYSDGYFLRAARFGEHSGTHINAPRTFYLQGASVDQIGPEKLLLPAVVFHVQKAAEFDPDYQLSVDEVLAWEQHWGSVPTGSLALLSTGWSRRWRVPQDYLNLDQQGQPHYPGFSLDAARFLLDDRGAAGLGTDTPGVDLGIDRAFSVNRLVLGQAGIVLENLAHLEQMPSQGGTLVVGPLKLVGGSGSPAAVFAFLP